MSAGYNNGLSEYPNKGTLNLLETEEESQLIKSKCSQLAKLIEQAQSVVFHTGAGISTSAGIPDFRGPKGVWTRFDLLFFEHIGKLEIREAKGETVEEGKKWVDTRPTFTHMGNGLFGTKLSTRV